MSVRLKSVCGLNCVECPAFIALKTDDNALRAKTAIEWSRMYGHEVSASDINCVGCTIKEGVHGGYCHACPLRACALGKGNANCCVCVEFADCEKRQSFEAQTKLNIKHNLSSE